MKGDIDKTLITLTCVFSDTADHCDMIFGNTNSVSIKNLSHSLQTQIYAADYSRENI